MMAPLVRRTWAPRGKTPVLYQKTRSYRKISVIAALTLPPKYRRVGLYFSQRRNTNFTAPHILRFLKDLSSQLQRPMIILWDRLQAHRSALVRRWLEKHPGIQTEYFPSYAPELNPVEPFWGYLKSNPLSNWAPRDIQELAIASRYHAGRVRKNKSVLHSFLYATPLFSRPH
jgi:transposase